MTWCNNENKSDEQRNESAASPPPPSNNKASVVPKRPPVLRTCPSCGHEFKPQDQVVHQSQIYMEFSLFLLVQSSWFITHRKTLLMILFSNRLEFRNYQGYRLGSSSIQQIKSCSSIWKGRCGLMLGSFTA